MWLEKKEMWGEKKDRSKLLIGQLDHFSLYFSKSTPINKVNGAEVIWNDLLEEKKKGTTCTTYSTGLIAKPLLSFKLWFLSWLLFSIQIQINPHLKNSYSVFVNGLLQQSAGDFKVKNMEKSQKKKKKNLTK